MARCVWVPASVRVVALSGPAAPALALAHAPGRPHSFACTIAFRTGPEPVHCSAQTTRHTALTLGPRPTSSRRDTLPVATLRWALTRTDHPRDGRGQTR